MRVFISHSSKDKWAARRIAKDIEELGHEVFIDEKDIATGDSIDCSVLANLKSSDHFLVLLSPASLNSPWVLIELGGALALEKKIVPILLYVGANEVPQAIILKLARDINEIDKYYRELGGSPIPPKAAAKTAHKELRAQVQRPRFNVGDRVLIARNTPQTILRNEGTNVSWTPEMNSYFNKLAEVTYVDADGDCQLDITADRFFWAPEWLQGL